MTVKELDQKLNEAILSGKAMEAYEELYDEGVVMQENSAEPTVGKAANRDRELAFFSSIEQFHGAGIGAQAVEGDTAFSEWWMDVTFKGGQRVKWWQATVRKWNNGKVTSERFYYAK
jgi:hypothetical protein